MVSATIELKTRDEIAVMREAGRIVQEILAELGKAVAPGVTTLDLDRLSESLARRKGVKPAFKGYHGFPASLCASVNEEVVHGIPSARRVLAEGDLVKLDYGVVHKGFYGDAAVTVGVGRIGDEARRLLEATREGLAKAIEKVVAGNRVSDLGGAIQDWVEAQGFSVVREFVGHGIGRALHEAPQIPNYRGARGADPRLKPGMVLAIEPMVNAGGWETEVLDDAWTAVTMDRRLSAHFEHTVAVTETGPVVLTLP